MSVASLIARHLGQPVTPVTLKENTGVTAAAVGREGRNPCNPCNPTKTRYTEKKPERVNPDALLLEIAQTLQASPASLKAMMDDDDIEATANGEYTPAYLLAFFKLKQEHGELLADQPRPPAPATRATQSRPGYVERVQVWKPAHDAMIDHLAACPTCYAPRPRYCTEGADLRRAYLQAYAAHVEKC